MSIDTTNEKRFESDIEASFLSPSGGYVKNRDIYTPQPGWVINTRTGIITKTRQNEWDKLNFRPEISR